MVFVVATSLLLGGTFLRCRYPGIVSDFFDPNQKVGFDNLASSIGTSNQQDSSVIFAVRYLDIRFAKTLLGVGSSLNLALGGIAGKGFRNRYRLNCDIFSESPSAKSVSAICALFGGQPRLEELQRKRPTLVQMAPELAAPPRFSRPPVPLNIDAAPSNSNRFIRGRSA